MSVRAFLTKKYQSISGGRAAWLFLLLALAATIIIAACARTLVYRSAANRFAAASLELRSNVAARVNRTIDLARTLAPAFDPTLETTKLSALVDGLDLDARYPGVNEVGLYTASQTGSLSRWAVKGNGLIAEGDVLSALAKNKNTPNQASIVRLDNSSTRYVVAVSRPAGGTFFLVFNAAAIAGRLCTAEEMTGAMNMAIYDGSDTLHAICQTSGSTRAIGTYDFRLTARIGVGDYPWTMYTTAKRDAMLSSVEQVVPTIILIFGLLASCAIFALLLMQNHHEDWQDVRQSQAEHIRAIYDNRHARLAKKHIQHVEKMNAELNKHTERIHELERLNRLMVNRELRMVELKKELALKVPVKKPTRTVKINAKKRHAKRA